LEINENELIDMRLQYSQNINTKYIRKQFEAHEKEVFAPKFSAHMNVYMLKKSQFPSR
jgi:hypothetical protein